MKTFEEYENAAFPHDRAPGNPAMQGLVYPSLALAGEAGELANEVKKFMRDDGMNLTAERRHKCILELGDVLWYAAKIARELGMSLAEVAEMNIVKLDNRRKFGKEETKWSGCSLYVSS